jgi:hypothetical protein
METPDQRIIDAYRKDTIIQVLKKRAFKDKKVHLTPDRYIRYYGKVYVPILERLRVIRENYKKPIIGY